jgi:hypothetical protein
MKVMTCLIEFPGNTLLKEMRKPASIHIDTSFKELIAKAEITLPRNVSFFDKYKPREVFKRDQPVIISYGYNGNLIKRFTGYIVGVSADYPITIKLQDEMYMVKKIPVNYSAKSTTLDQLLKSIVKGYTINALEGVQLGSIRLAKTHVGAVLEKIRSDFGIYSYMDGKTLISGKYYADNTTDKIETLNLDTFIAENSLEYTNTDDVIALVKGKTTVKNVKVEYQIGQEGGDVYDFEYKLATSLDVLKSKVNSDYARIRRGGYKGTLSAFGEPHFKHGLKVNLVSTIYPDRNGTYYIDAVTEDYSEQGIRQTLIFGGIGTTI